MALSQSIKIFILPLIGAMIWAGCSTTKSGAVFTSDGAWADARAKFLDGDYLEAELALNTVKLQFPGSTHSDSVQFLLGECNVHEGKNLLGAYEFGAIHRSFPMSPLNRLAQFRIAECYYHLAPPSNTDQEYGAKAIEEYQAFIELYGKSAGPDDSLTIQASNRIKELRSRMGKKFYDTAVLYATMNLFKASNVYCDLLQEKYYDTEFADRAQLMKIKNFIEMKKYGDANHEIEKFLSTYRTSPLVPDVRALRESISDKIAKQ